MQKQQQQRSNIKMQITYSSNSFSLASQGKKKTSIYNTEEEPHTFYHYDYYDYDYYYYSR
jgi:hypothetical protein